MKISKTIVISMGVVLLIGLVACSQEVLNEKDQPQIIKTDVITTLLVEDDVTRFHQVPAVFLATNRANLSFQLSGTVNHVMVKIGEQVEKDQALMSVYNPNIDPALESNLAQQESIKAKIFQVKRDVANLKELRKNNSASKNVLEHKQTDLKDLLAQQKAVKAQIDLALANQSESIIKAPFDGSIVFIGKQTGEFVAAGHEVMTINGQSNLEVEVNITQPLWNSINMGDSVNAVYQGEEVVFKVIELAQTADAQSHLMKVILQSNQIIDNAIGQQVILNFPQKYKNVYQLPLETIVDDGINKPYIFTVVDNIATKNPIQPLYIENGNIIFKSLEKISDAVVVKGQSKISDGMQLKVLQ